ncbi:hypothetical protein ACWD4N_45880, partial [Streptomyces sp. NPDC002586]
MGDGQFPVDGVGVHLVRPRRRQFGQHLRQCRVVRAQVVQVGAGAHGGELGGAGAPDPDLAVG